MWYLKIYNGNHTGKWQKSESWFILHTDNNKPNTKAVTQSRTKWYRILMSRMPFPLSNKKCKSMQTNLEVLTLSMDFIFSTRCNIYISRLCYDVSVRLSVTEVHWRIIANLGFKFWSKFTAHCGRGACGCEQWAWEKGSTPGRVEGSSRAMLATARPSCFFIHHFHPPKGRALLPLSHLSNNVNREPCSIYLIAFAAWCQCNLPNMAMLICQPQTKLGWRIPNLISTDSFRHLLKTYLFAGYSACSALAVDNFMRYINLFTYLLMQLK